MCGYCGFDLNGRAATYCPECGTALVAKPSTTPHVGQHDMSVAPAEGAKTERADEQVAETQIAGRIRGYLLPAAVIALIVLGGLLLSSAFRSNDEPAPNPDSVLSDDSDEVWEADQQSPAIGDLDVPEDQYRLILRQLADLSLPDRRGFCADFRSFAWADVYDFYFQAGTDPDAAFAAASDSCA